MSTKIQNLYAILFYLYFKFFSIMLIYYIMYLILYILRFYFIYIYHTPLCVCEHFSFKCLERKTNKKLKCVYNI